MTARPPRTCRATRTNDQMFCHRCKLMWDVDDPDRPECATVPAAPIRSNFKRRRK